jgi:hypothetical protein
VTKAGYVAEPMEEGFVSDLVPSLVEIPDGGSLPGFV